MRYDYSGEIRTILKKANLEAEAIRHDYIGTEHILLALLDQDRGPALNVLGVVGIDPRQLRARVLDSVRPGSAGKPMKSRPYTSLAKHVLEYMMAAAREVGPASRGSRNATLDSDHLLLGLIREKKGIAAQALESLGATKDTVTEAVLRLRGLSVQSRTQDLEGSSGRTAAEVKPGDDSVWYVELDLDQGTPIYEQIISRIEEAVATNLLLPGERLPPVRDLAAELGVAPGTVARAYRALEQRGVLETEGARGTRVAAPPASSKRNRNLQPAIADLLRPIAVAAYHMGAQAQDVHAALQSAMSDIFPRGQT